MSKQNEQEEVGRVIAQALAEDAGDLGDITTKATMAPNATATGVFLAKATGCLSGIEVANRVFRTVDSSLVLDWTKKDGDHVKTGERFGTVSGDAGAILTAERIALNLMQRMSGIATLTAQMVREIDGVGSKTRLLDTRKTAPGLRLLDKIAVRHGGGTNHRMGLYDMVMIKDNHIEAAGGLRPAVERVSAYLETNGLTGTPVEVEVEDDARLAEAIQCVKDGLPITRIMLDNMTVDQDTTRLEAALAVIRESGVAVETEASGNIRLETIASVAKTGVDFASCGALTHSVKALDISLKFALHKAEV